MTLRHLGIHKFDAIKIGQQNIQPVLDGYRFNPSVLDGYARVPDTAATGDGYIAFFTSVGRNLAGDNDLFWDRAHNRLGIGTSAPTHLLTVDGYITPLTDNLHDLGTPTQRWHDLWLGPGSLHLRQSPSQNDTGREVNWHVSIGNAGELTIKHAVESFVKLSSDGSGAIAIGQNSQATTADSTSVGRSASVAVANGTAIGSGATLGSSATGGSIAIGKNVSVNVANAIGIGASTVTGSGATAVGVGSIASGTDSTALGGTASAAGLRATAVGNANASADNTVAVGYGSIATGASSVVIGVSATCNAEIQNTIVGQTASVGVGAGSSVVIGTGANATANGSAIAIGVSAATSNAQAIAIGRTSAASGQSSTAIGHASIASGSRSTAIGGLDNSSISATASGDESVAVGDGAQATIGASTAIGGLARATASFAVALGYNANAGYTNSLAIGANAVVTEGNQAQFGTVDQPINLVTHGRITLGSATDGNLTLRHNGIDGYIQTSGGHITLGPFDGYVIPAVDDAYSLGSPINRWKELWLGPDSLHIYQPASAGPLRDWRFGINSSGHLDISQSASKLLSISEAGRMFVAAGNGSSSTVPYSFKDSAGRGTDCGLGYFFSDFGGGDTRDNITISVAGTTLFSIYKGPMQTPFISIGGGFPSAVGFLNSGAWSLTSNGVLQATAQSLAMWVMQAQDNVRDVRIIGSADATNEYAARIGTKYTAAQGGNLATLLQVGLDIDGTPVGTAEFYGDGRLSLLNSGQALTLRHNGIDGYIQTTLGHLMLSPQDGYVTPAVDDAYSLGSPALRWKELWLGSNSLHLYQPASIGPERDWRLSIGPGGDLNISQSADRYIKITAAGNIASAAVGPLILGAPAISSHSLVSSDVITGGTLEVDGSLFVDGSFLQTAAIQGPNGLTTIGSMFWNGTVYWSSSEQLPFMNFNTSFDQQAFFTSTASGEQFVFGDGAYLANDFGHPTQQNPTIFVHSSFNPVVDSTQWISLRHTRVDGYIETGKGSLILAPIDGYVSPGVDDGYSLGSQTRRWKELWLGSNSLHLYKPNDANGIERDWSLRIGSGGSFVLKQSNDQGLLITTPDIGSLALGYKASVALGQFHTAIGSGASASSVNGSNTAIGYNAVITNAASTSVAIGANAAISSTGASSVAIGYTATTSASNTTVIGYLASADASSNQGIAIGYNTMVAGANAIAIGSSAPAIASGAIAIGVGTGGAGSNSIAIGTGTANGSTDAVAIGTGAGISANQGISIGSNSSSLSSSGNGTGSIAVGYSATADGGGIAIGWSAATSNTSTSRSIAIGYNATTLNFTNALAVGENARPALNNQAQFGTLAKSMNTVIYGSLTLNKNNKLIVLEHNGSDGYLETTAGHLILAPADGEVVPAGDGYGFGNPNNRWYDGYFSDINTRGFVADIISIIAANSPYTAKQTNYTILANAVDGNITVNLPGAGDGNLGRIYNVKKVDSSGNTVTIQASGGQNIDNGNVHIINAQYTSRTVQSDGSNWWII